MCRKAPGVHIQYSNILHCCLAFRIYLFLYCYVIIMSLLEQAPDWLTRVNIRQSKNFPNPQNAQIVLISFAQNVSLN